MALVRQRATLSLYVDGTLADTKTASTEAIIYQPIEPFRIGRSAGTGENSPFAPNGAFDDLYLYRKALTQCEVIQLVGRQNCVAPPTPTSVTLPPTATPVPTATPTPYPTPDRSPQINVTMEGVGSVTSNPAGINCAAGVCKLNYPSSVTSVTLTANPIPGGSFIGWQAWPCPTTGATCTVNPNQIVFVRARFNPQPTPQPSGVYPPQINVNVKGPGTVTSEPSGVNCTAGWCQNMFPASATSVKLTANAPAGSIFRGWGAWPCPATGATCTVNP
ncbi:MAG: hypothetical protein NTZ05_04485, partial [Chloroflexi bacterium]|nr:hypothetical protein [Chloroflexota bacterium]